VQAYRRRINQFGSFYELAQHNLTKLTEVNIFCVEVECNLLQRYIFKSHGKFDDNDGRPDDEGSKDI
jgi:hypothetical protein